MNRCTPLIQRDPAVAQQEALVAINHKLKAKEVCTSINENAVAFLSAVTLDEAPLEKLTLEERIQTPTPDDYAAYVECKRQKRRRNRAAKEEAAKAAELQQPAKEPEAPAPDIVSNNQSLFQTWQSLRDHIQDMSNPRYEENGEPLFQKLLQNHENPFNVNRVNPWHPIYGYYKSLISGLQVWDEYMDSVISDPEDDTSDDDRPVGGKRKSGWKKPCVYGLFDNELDSYTYDDYGYHRYVTNLQSTTNTNEKQLLIQALSSIGSNVDKIHSVIASECVNCVECKTRDNTNLMANSSASVHITMNRSELEYEEIKDGIHLNTTSKSAKPLQVRGKGVMFLTMSEDHRGQEPVSQLYPVYYVTGVSH